MTQASRNVRFLAIASAVVLTSFVGAQSASAQAQLLLRPLVGEIIEGLAGRAAIGTAERGAIAEGLEAAAARTSRRPIYNRPQVRIYNNTLKLAPELSIAPPNTQFAPNTQAPVTRQARTDQVSAADRELLSRVYKTIGSGDAAPPDGWTVTGRAYEPGPTQEDYDLVREHYASLGEPPIQSALPPGWHIIDSNEAPVELPPGWKIIRR